MNRPAILDLDLVVVPREATDEMLEPTGDSYSLSTLWDAMISALPYPTAWDDVRKYVDGLEKECERLKFLVEWGEAFCDMKHPDTARAEAAEARIAELEKRLADAERVIEPFANSDGDVEWQGDDSCAYGCADFTVGHLRAARAYMEGK